MEECKSPVRALEILKIQSKAEGLELSAVSRAVRSSRGKDPSGKPEAPALEPGDGHPRVMVRTGAPLKRQKVSLPSFSLSIPPRLQACWLMPTPSRVLGLLSSVVCHPVTPRTVLDQSAKHFLFKRTQPLMITEGNMKGNKETSNSA